MKTLTIFALIVLVSVCIINISRNNHQPNQRVRNLTERQYKNRQKSFNTKMTKVLNQEKLSAGDSRALEIMNAYNRDVLGKKPKYNSRQVISKGDQQFIDIQNEYRKEVLNKNPVILK